MSDVLYVCVSPSAVLLVLLYHTKPCLRGPSTLYRGYFVRCCYFFVLYYDFFFTMYLFVYLDLGFVYMLLLIETMAVDGEEV